MAPYEAIEMAIILYYSTEMQCAGRSASCTMQGIRREQFMGEMLRKQSAREHGFERVRFTVEQT